MKTTNKSPNCGNKRGKVAIKRQTANKNNKSAIKNIKTTNKNNKSTIKMVKTVNKIKDHPYYTRNEKYSPRYHLTF